MRQAVTDKTDKSPPAVPASTPYQGTPPNASRCAVGESRRKDVPTYVLAAPLATGGVPGRLRAYPDAEVRENSDDREVER